jgi:YidC/Oxa1 family membrane protein insertase
MVNVRLFLWITFLAMMWLVYTTWTNERTPPIPAQTATEDGAASTPRASDTLPQLEAPGATPAAADGAATAAAPSVTAAPAPSDLVRVRTDVLDVVISLQGGDLVRADLRNYPVDKHQPDNVVRLLDYEPATRWVFQTGILRPEGQPAPNHRATFRSASQEYSLADGEDTLTVTLDWVGEGGVSAQKIYTFRRGQYAIDLDLAANAPAGESWSVAQPYAQMSRLYVPIERSYISVNVDNYSVSGPTLFDGESFEKLKFDDLARTPVVDRKITDGWFAAIQHHFVAAAVPPKTDEVTYNAKTIGQEFVLTASGPVSAVDAAMPFDYRFTLFVGPKLQDQLKVAGTELERTVDYGVLYTLAQPLFFVLSTVDRYVGNWGWSIVIVTILIKLLFYKLTAMSGRSMAKMRKIAPRMKALQERYKDDRQALSQAMMELYKKEKVNPAAGCLPILIQMPFFFSFYWVLIESVEMRQAPFMLWIDDLSARDPYFVLPLLMGVAMFFQTKMSPAPPDPMQARVMQIMPLIFTAFFFLFPSGLVLYWLTNTVLGILQQWRINKVVEAESAAA